MHLSWPYLVAFIHLLPLFDAFRDRLLYLGHSYKGRRGRGSDAQRFFFIILVCHTRFTLTHLCRKMELDDSILHRFSA